MRGFRVWSNYWKKYATEAELHMDGSADAYFESSDGVPHHENADLVVEQYTGLKDKNGKEIYEGDILQQGATPRGRFAVVKWVDASAEFIVLDIRNHRQIPFSSWTARNSLAVLGNIHENPELLKGAECVI